METFLVLPGRFHRAQSCTAGVIDNLRRSRGDWSRHHSYSSPSACFSRRTHVTRTRLARGRRKLSNTTRNVSKVIKFMVAGVPYSPLTCFPHTLRYLAALNILARCAETDQQALELFEEAESLAEKSTASCVYRRKGVLWDAVPHRSAWR
jgi:hypothetical protein